MRILRHLPEHIEDFADRIKEVLKERHHGVLVAGVQLIISVVESKPKVADRLPPLHILRTMLPSVRTHLDVGNVGVLSKKFVRRKEVVNVGCEPIVPRADQQQADTVVNPALTRSRVPIIRREQQLGATTYYGRQNLHLLRAPLCARPIPP